MFRLLKMPSPGARGSITNQALLTSMKLQIRSGLETAYPDVYTPEVLSALASLARFNEAQKALMVKRIKRRTERARKKQHIEFFDPTGSIPGTSIKVQDGILHLNARARDRP